MRQVAGKSINFLIDTGATYSVLPSFGGTLRPSQVSVLGVDGRSSRPLQTGPQPCQLDHFLFTHSFLIIPSCPTPLLGLDILAKLRVTIHLPLSFSQSLTLPLLFLCSPEAPIVNRSIWDTEIPLVATHHTPILIKVHDPSHFPSRPQFPISQTHLRGLKPIIAHLLGQGLLVPTASPCNSPILPVRKTSGSYRLVQDLQLINEAVIPAHPIVPNPYTLPSDIPSSTIHFTVIDLKDAFFTIPLHPDCQFLFAFT